MLTDSAKDELRFVLKKLCQNYNLEHAYLARKIGKRRHFLVGYGKESFTQTNHIDLTNQIIIFWQGQPQLFDIKERLDNLIQNINQLVQ